MVLATLPKQAEKQTIQEFETDARHGALPGWYYAFYRGSLLYPWGDSRRTKQLWDFYVDPYNWPVQGAFSAIVKQIISTPYEIKGDQEHKNLTRHYERVLSGAQFDSFGGGFRGLVSRTVLDFLRFDDGAFVEIIGGGNPYREIKGRVNGIAHLNSLRCAATGEPEHPVVYQARKTGKMHYLHRSRVARLVDMPDGVDDETGRGLSALARAISIAQTLMLQSKYILQRLDDLPPSGLLSLHNIKDWKGARKQYEADRKRDGGSVWANVMVVESLEPDKAPAVSHVPFASTPEHFDFRNYTEMLLTVMALALNIDPQDLLPLSGAPLGTGTQTKILHSKAAGKMLGDIRTGITRMINFYILPDSLEFQFKYKDPEQDKDVAETEAVLAGTAQTLKAVIGDELAAQYLVNCSERFADVLLDEQGQLRLPDDDPKPAEMTIPQLPEVPDTEMPNTQGSENPPANQPADDTLMADSDTPLQQKKDIQATRLDFEGDFEDMLKAAASGSMDRRRAGVVGRALLSKFIRQGFTDGLVKGGVTEPPDNEDMNTIATLVSNANGFLTRLLDTIYQDGLTDIQIASKPAQWWVQSVQPAYLEGQGSADKNGMYEWVLGMTEHCDTCKRLAGQIHRMKDWLRKQFYPGSPKLDCHPGPCGCKFVRRPGARASGRF
jgi:hypothetical protein